MTHQGFLQSIIEHPDDDLPRLVYADWLDDEGDEDRAEFIRGQIRLAREPKTVEAGLSERMTELLTRHVAIWRQPFSEDNSPQWNRGFIERATLTAGELANETGKQYFSQTPLREIGLTSEGEPETETYARLATRPWIAQLETLDCYSQAMGEDAGRALFASPYLARLKRLYLGEGDTTPGMVTILGQSSLETLQELYLWDFHSGELGDDGMAILAESPRWRTLSVLDLLHTGFGPAGAQALASSPHLGNLEQLSLGRLACGYAPNRIGPEGAAALAGSANLAGLKGLGLAMNQLGDEGLTALASSPHLRQLRHLSLQSNDVTDAGLSALALSPLLPSVTLLDLSHNRVGDRGVRALATSHHSSSLEVLWLFGNQVGPAGVKALASSPHLKNLRRLCLARNPIGHKAVAALLSGETFAQLAELNLQSTDLTDADKGALKTRFGDRVKL